MASPTRNGSCLCGAIKFTLSDPTTAGIVCHCSSCRKATSCQSLNLAVPRAAVAVTQGTPAGWRDAATLSGQAMMRHFCGTCGSPLWSAPDSAPSLYYLKAGLLDDGWKDVTLAAEVFTDSAIGWDVYPAKLGQKQLGTVSGGKK